jgi:4-hydroxy-3-polyprenylbenzoate decarboxylase
MQKTIELLKSKDMIRIIDEEVDIDLEIPHISYIEVKKEDSKTLLFTHPVSKRLGKKFDMPVLTNLYASFKHTELFFGKDPDVIAQEVEKLLHLKPPVGMMDKISMAMELFDLKNVFPKRLSRRGESQQVVREGDEANLYDLPVLTTWEEDGGSFITMGQVYTESLDGTKQNVGMYRLQVYSENRLGLHWQIHKDGAHFFHEYKQAGKKMPVSIGIGGDPLYIWCGQAPLPAGLFELLLYGFAKKENPRLVQSLTNPIYVPEDVDFVIEGWVDPEEMATEGPFGDHTGYYTLKEPYPVLNVTAITSKKNPVFAATVVGKPPLEDKYMGWATERIFMPLLKTTVPDLIDYAMPENGVFHNLILAKIRTLYPGHAKQSMHAFWGVGQMSFVKHAVFVNESAPHLEDYEELSRHILNRLDKSRILISEGVCDALDHSSPSFAYGGKLGVDATGDEVEDHGLSIMNDAELLTKVQALDTNVAGLKQYMCDTKTPIVVLSVDKKESMRVLYGKLAALREHIKLVIIFDHTMNDLENPYMLIWRCVNNIDAQRDIYLDHEIIGVDGTNKNALDGYTREWPGDTDCSPEVIENLRKRGLVDVDEAFLDRWFIVPRG